MKNAQSMFKKHIQMQNIHQQEALAQSNISDTHAAPSLSRHSTSLFSSASYVEGRV
jgi:hypothetical protein